MGKLVCLNCGARRAARHTSVAFKCREGWQHYGAVVCRECFEVLEGLVEAVSPLPAYVQLELPARARIGEGA